MEKLQNTIKEFGTKIDQLSHMAKTMREEQERMKNLLNSWEVKQKRIEGELSFVADWHRKNNLLIFGIDECPHESYSAMLKMTEEFLRTKMKVDVMNWHIDSIMRIGRRRGSRLDFGKIHLIFKENGSIERNLKFSRNKYKD
jgi:hypothetical protein